MFNLRRRLRALRRGDRGSSTLEYTLLLGVGGVMVGVLLRVITSDATYNAMSKLVGGVLG